MSIQACSYMDIIFLANLLEVRRNFRNQIALIVVVANLLLPHSFANFVP
jgi:hypothetical protein